MAIFIASSGFLLVGLIIYDAVKTTLAATGAGPITGWLGRLVWLVALWMHRRLGRKGVLRAVGPWLTVGLITVWVGLVWLGWWLVFSSHEVAVFHPASGTYANPLERLYFVGYTLTTLGYGDFVAGTGKWQVLSVLAAANGFFLLTLAVTYILSVMSALVQKRQLALSIHTLGATPAGIVSRFGESGNIEELARQADGLKATIISVGQQHLAYPILHYYHQPVPNQALPVALFRLYQSLAIVCYGHESLSPSVRFQLESTLHALNGFLGVLDHDFLRPARQAPKIDTAWLPATASLATPPERLRQDLEQLESQRLWLAFIHKDGWDWKTVWCS